MPPTKTAAICLTILLSAAQAQPPAPATPPPPAATPSTKAPQPPTAKPADGKTPPKVVEPKPADAPKAKGTELDPKTKLADAKPNTIYTAVSGCTGYTEDGLDRVGLLKYSWVVPEGFRAGQPRDVVVVLHGYGLDHTWSPAALPADILAPGAIVVSPDGSREAPDGARFPGLEIADVILMRDFVLEMTRTFPTAKIVLVGHSQGAFAQIMLANRFPRLFNGVVCYGGGVPKMPMMGLKVVPAAFIHGTDDDLVPLRVAVEGRDVIVAEGAKAAVLRRVIGGGHNPDAKEAALGVAWVRALVTDKPDEALAGAKSLLTVAADSPRSPAFGMAQAICKRFEADPEDRTAWPRGLKDATDEQKKEAKALSAAIEAQGLRQVAALRAALPDAATLRAATFAPDTPTPNWLGHLLSLREDFMGVESVDAFMTELKYEELLAEHEEAGKKIVEALESAEWGGNGATPIEAFEIMLENLPKAYLVEGLPHGLEANMKDWYTRADEIRIPQTQRDLYPVVTQYLGAVKKGRERYKAINAQWKPSGK